MIRSVLAFLCTSTLAYGSAILITDPTLMNTSTDYINWSTLGPDHTSVLQSFIVGSSQYDLVRGRLDNGSGTVVVAGNDWKNTGATQDSMNPANSGIVAKDELLRTSDGSNGDAPLTLSFNNIPIYGAGAFVQADGFGQFTARLQAFAGFNSVFDMTVTSDTKGDAVFLGVADDAQEITKIVYSLTSAPKGYALGDFAVDTLYVQNGLVIIPQPPVPQQSGVPEPGMAPLLGVVLLAVGMKLRNRWVRL